MNTKKMAESNLNEAEVRLNAAKRALEEKHYAFTIRQSQECVELALKGALRYVCVEPPKWHDVGIVLRREKEKFPTQFKEHINRLVSISRKLRREREPSVYGDEELGIPAEELYTETDAEESLKDAQLVFDLCKKLSA